MIRSFMTQYRACGTIAEGAVLLVYVLIYWTKVGLITQGYGIEYIQTNEWYARAVLSPRRL